MSHSGNRTSTVHQSGEPLAPDLWPLAGSFPCIGSPAQVDLLRRSTPPTPACSFRCGMSSRTQSILWAPLDAALPESTADLLTFRWTMRSDLRG